MDLANMTIDLMDAPHPRHVGAWKIAQWCKEQPFAFNSLETALLDRVIDKCFTCEPSSVRELQDLRVLYWQVVGFLRNK